MISFLIYPPEQTKTYPSKQESRKIIIDSKVPVGMGDVTSREGRSPDHSTKPDTLSSATTSIRIIVRLTANLWISMGSWRRGVVLYFLLGVLFNTKVRKLRSKHTKYISILNMFKTKCNSFVYNIYIYIYTRDYTRSPVVTMGWVGVGLMTFLTREHIFDATEMMTFLAHEHIFDATEMMTFFAHEHIFGATEMMTFFAHVHIFGATDNWGGLGWGGADDVRCTWTHLWCYGDDDVPCTWTHLWRYGDDDVPCTWTHLWRYGDDDVRCTCTHLWCVGAALLKDTTRPNTKEFKFSLLQHWTESLA